MYKEFRRLILLIVTLLYLGIVATTNAAVAEENDQTDLARKSQNPVSSMISVPIENISSFNNGPNDAYVNTILMKPVLPVQISESWNLINRAIVPVVYQGEVIDGIGSEFGIGDITYQGFFSPTKPGKLIWGAGPIISLPTGNSRMTTNKWAAGPSAVALVMPGQWVVGGVISNLWSFAGDAAAESVNFLSLQYFVNYNMADGWYLSSTPTITANWNERSGNKWTVPFGGGVGRVFNIGKQPVNAGIRAYYNVVHPDNASNWNISLQIAFLFPK